MNAKVNGPTIDAEPFSSQYQAKTLLIMLFGKFFQQNQGYIEFRIIGDKPIAKNKTVPVVIRRFHSSIESATSNVFLEELRNWNDSGLHIYIGVLPRTRESGTAKDVEFAPSLWADLDFKDFDEGEAGAWEKVRAFPLKPSMIVSSGHGLHLYWLLSEPYVIADASKISGIIKGIAERLNGDFVFDLPRVLRLTGFINCKKGRDPVPCELLSEYLHPELEYALQDFEEYWIDPGEEREVVDIVDCSQEVPERFWERLKNNKKLSDTWLGKRILPKDNSRSGFDMSLTDQLVVDGFANQEIAAILRQSPSGKGKDASNRYIAYTIAKARGTEKKLKEEMVDVSQFKPMSIHEVGEVLGLTIMKDDRNKIVTFLAQLSAYTEDSQLNLSFQAPSSTGKSFIPMEIAKLFPEKDVIEIGYCSPTAFFHDHGVYDENKKGYVMDLSRKILVFLDQPHTQLLQHLRPLLSHDKKEVIVKITDKSQKMGLKTKNIFLRGYPAVIFCTAGLKIDEQESTRFLLLSPETSQDKIRAAIYAKIRKESDSENYKASLKANDSRTQLQKRILGIKQESISDIRISCPDKIEERFFSHAKTLKPRHQRDIGRIVALTKIHALWNVWFRERSGSTIIAIEEDVIAAFDLWDGMSESQELNLPPYIHQIYKEIILPTWREANKGLVRLMNESEQGLTRQDISKAHMTIYGRPLAAWLLRQQILPMLEDVGLITQEADVNDRRKIIIYPTAPLIESPEKDMVSGPVG